MVKLINSLIVTYRFIHTGPVCFKNIVIRKPIKVLNLQTNVIETGSVNHMKTVQRNSNEDLVPAIIKKPEENVVPYRKLPKYDSRFTKTLATIKDRKKREKSGKILLEGKRLINDAMKAGMQIKALYFSREKDLNDIKLENCEGVEVSKVLYRTLQVWSGLTTCPGVLAIFKRPTAEEMNVLSHPTLPVTILCDNIREPGNLGSIIRNAAAVGCENVLLTKGCVDPWEMKVLRAGCGGHFRIPIVNNIEWSQVSNYIPSTSTIFVADNKANIEEVSSDVGFINFDEPKEKTEEEEEEEETRYFTYNEQNQRIHVDETFDLPEELEKYKDIPLPCYLYTGINYPKKDIVLYIGGETEGVNPRIVKLASEFGGKKVRVPMENGMDSLNSAFSMTVILYEIKRQQAKLYISK